MNLIIRWVLSAILVIFIGWIIPGITVTNFISAMIAVVVIGLINIFIRPLVEFISLPINFLTLGLFGLVVNALLLILAGKIAPGIEIDGFWSAFFGSIIMSIFAPMIANINAKK